MEMSFYQFADETNTEVFYRVSVMDLAVLRLELYHCRLRTAQLLILVDKEHDAIAKKALEEKAAPKPPQSMWGYICSFFPNGDDYLMKRPTDNEYKLSEEQWYDKILCRRIRFLKQPKSAMATIEDSSSDDEGPVRHQGNPKGGDDNGRDTYVPTI